MSSSFKHANIRPLELQIHKYTSRYSFVGYLFAFSFLFVGIGFILLNINYCLVRCSSLIPSLPFPLSMPHLSMSHSLPFWTFQIHVQIHVQTLAHYSKLLSPNSLIYLVGYSSLFFYSFLSFSSSTVISALVSLFLSTAWSDKSRLQMLCSATARAGKRKKRPSSLKYNWKPIPHRLFRFISSPFVYVIVTTSLFPLLPSTLVRMPGKNCTSATNL